MKNIFIYFCPLSHQPNNPYNSDYGKKKFLSLSHQPNNYNLPFHNKITTKHPTNIPFSPFQIFLQTKQLGF